MQVKGESDQGGREGRHSETMQEDSQATRQRLLSLRGRERRGANRRTEVDIWVRHKDGEIEAPSQHPSPQTQLEIDFCPKHDAGRAIERLLRGRGGGGPGAKEAEVASLEAELHKGETSLRKAKG